MQRQVDAAEVQQRRAELFHRTFYWLDLALATTTAILSLVEVRRPCGMAFYAYFALFFLGQAIQHFFCLKMPNMDVVQHEKILKRYLYVVSGLQISYFMMSFMFWTRSDVHPLYCFVVSTLGVPFPIGMLFTVHFVATLLLYIQFLHGFITRKYYLLAIGGFAVEQRLIQEREENLRRVALIEPFYNEYPVLPASPTRKVKAYEFNDIAEDVEGEEVCSICLTRSKEGHHPIYTLCHHYFHRECIEDWARINNKCPECRAQFKELLAAKAED